MGFLKCPAQSLNTQESVENSIFIIMALFWTWVCRQTFLTKLACRAHNKVDNLDQIYEPFLLEESCWSKKSWKHDAIL